MDEDYLEAVLDLVAEVPPGRVMTYGSIAEVLVDDLGRGGPRQVGQVLARAGSGVPWWRVVNAAGQPPVHKRDLALQRLADEGCPLTPGCDRVRVGVALWWPEPGASRTTDPDGTRGSGGQGAP